MQTQRNFERIITSLYYLDTFLSGQYIKSAEIRKQDILMMKYVIDGGRDNVMLDEYIENTIECFTSNKQMITLDLEHLYAWKKEIQDVIMNRIESAWYKKREDNDLTNLFRAELITNAFCNIKEMMIKTNHNYTFSMVSLLSIIKESLFMLERMTLQLGHRGHMDQIRKCYAISLSLKESYKEAGYRISELIDNAGKNCKQVWCIIERISE